MDSLLHAAVEAEDILNGARGVKTEWSVVDGKMTWSEDKPPPPGEECGVRFRNAHPPSASKLGSAQFAPDKFDLFRKLHELYEELNRDESMQSTCQGLKTTTYLLEKLLARVNLNTLIINLYPGNKGYSLSLKINGNTQYLHLPDGNVPYNQEDALIETPRWPYEEEELLSYIDNEELPVILVDLLEVEHSCLFYSGCIIAQIRDYRQAYPTFMCDTHHVLLKPTNQSIITDVNSVSGRCGWGGEDRAALEAALVLATAPPLCLEPRPAVGLLAARLHAERRLLNTPHIRRRAKRFSQVAVNRKRKLDQFTHHHGLELLDVIHKQTFKNGRQPGPHSRLSSKYPKKPPEVFKPVEPPRTDTLPLAVPSMPGEALRLARAYERPRPTQDCQAQLVEEYILETEKTNPHSSGGFFHIKLSILQRPSDQEFLGELYVDRDHVEGERNGAACRFSLGSRVHANKYIQQFTEIFTEEGRKSVRIKHIVPGQLPRVSFTAGMREMQGQQIVLQQRPASTSSAATQPHPVNVPIITTASSTTSTATPHTVNTARSLPILQAQLQCGSGTVAGPSVVGGGAGTGAGSGSDTPSVVHKQQPSPVGLHLSPQVHDVQSSQPSANQLLAQQLTNPPQPLNTKIQPAIIHIQHPLMPTATQGQSIQLGSQQYTVSSVASSPAQVQKVSVSKPRTTNPAISALVTSLMNSAHQFQQQAASQNAAKSSSATTTSNNATILNLLNSAPAAMTHPTTADSLPTSLAHMEANNAHKTLGRTVSHSTHTTTPSPAVHTYTRQVMGGYCEDAGTAAVSSDGTLLERLMGSGAGGGGGAGEAEDAATAPAHAPQVLPQQALHLPSLSLASLQGLQGIQGLQNVQVQIPGLAAPISLSLNVSGASGGLLVSVPPTTSVVLTNQPSVLSLPIAQLMSSGVKGGVRGGVQLVRARAPVPRPQRPLSAAPPPTANAQFLAQSQQQVLTTHQVRRKSNSTDGSQ